MMLEWGNRAARGCRVVPAIPCRGREPARVLRLPMLGEREVFCLLGGSLLSSPT